MCPHQRTICWPLFKMYVSWKWLKWGTLSFFFLCLRKIHFNDLYFTTTVMWQLLCSVTHPLTALNLVRSILWGGTVPLTSVYGESVSTPAILRACIGFVIRRMNQDAGGSMKSWALGHDSVATRKWMLFIRRLCLSFAVNTQWYCPHESGSSVRF